MHRSRRAGHPRHEGPVVRDSGQSGFSVRWSSPGSRSSAQGVYFTPFGTRRARQWTHQQRNPVPTAHLTYSAEWSLAWASSCSQWEPASSWRPSAPTPNRPRALSATASPASHRVFHYYFSAMAAGSSWTSPETTDSKSKRPTKSSESTDSKSKRPTKSSSTWPK